MLNVIPSNMQYCSPEVGMLPEASAEGNIPTKDHVVQFPPIRAEHISFA